jgi:hypothetical protein
VRQFGWKSLVALILDQGQHLGFKASPQTVDRHLIFG